MIRLHWVAGPPRLKADSALWVPSLYMKHASGHMHTPLSSFGYVLVLDIGSNVVTVRSPKKDGSLKRHFRRLIVTFLVSVSGRNQ